MQMTKVKKITLSPSRDIPFNKLVLSQSNVRRVKAGVSIERLAESIAQRTLLQSLDVRAVVDGEGNETGILEVPAGGRRYRALELLVKQKGEVKRDRCLNSSLMMRSGRSRSTKIRNNLMPPNNITSNDGSGRPALVAADGGQRAAPVPIFIGEDPRGRAGPGTV
jgi:hypothetical protein